MKFTGIVAVLALPLLAAAVPGHKPSKTSSSPVRLPKNPGYRKFVRPVFRTQCDAPFLCVLQICSCIPCTAIAVVILYADAIGFELEDAGRPSPTSYSD